MIIIFRGDPAELERGAGLSRQSIELEGVVFPMGVAVDASSLSERLQSKLRTNNHFEVVEAAKALEVRGDAPAADAQDAPAAEAAPAAKGKKKGTVLVSPVEE